MQYFPAQGDIIIIDFDSQVGFEQLGRRPALVVSNGIYNRHCKMAIVCPITNTDKGHAFHIPLDNSTRTTGVVLCDQARALDINARNAVFMEVAPDDVIDRATDMICSFID